MTKKSGRRLLPLAAPSKGSPGTPVSLRQMLRLVTSARLTDLVARTIGAFDPKRISHQTRKLMRLDPTVAFGLAIQEAPIVNMAWTIESEDPDIARFAEQALRPHYRGLASAATLALPFGLAVVAKEWVTDQPFDVLSEDLKTHAKVEKHYPSAWVYRRFKGIDPVHLEILVDPALDDWTGIKQSDPKRPGQYVTVGHEGAIFWSLQREKVWGSLGGWPLLDAAYAPWWEKGATDLYADRYFERKADPPYKGRASATIRRIGGREEDGLQYLAEQAIMLRNGGVFVLPNQRDQQGNYLFDIEAMPDDKRGDMFQQRIDGLDLRILRGLLITDRSGTAGGAGGIGTGEAEVHARTLAGTQEAIRSEWIEVLESQVLAPLVALNFGPDAARKARPRIRTAGLEESQRSVMKDLVTALLQTEAAQGSGERVTLADRIDVPSVLDQLGIPQLSQEEIAETLADRQMPEIPEGGGRKPEAELTDEERAAVADGLKDRGHLED